MQKYIKKYPDRIIYIEKENGGAASARNVGLEIAKGKYIGFIDADDYIDDCYVDKLLNMAYKNDADIVKCGNTNVKDGGIVSEDCRSDDIIKGEMGRKIFDYPSYVWAGIFKSGLIEKVRFPESYWYEDMIVRFLLYRRSRMFINISTPLYYRVSHPNQITKMKMTPKDYKCLDHLYLVELLVEENEKYYLNDDVWLYLNVVHECSTIMVNRIDKLDDEIKQQVFLRARKLVSGLYKKEYEPYLKGEWKIKSDVILKGRYDLWKMLKWL